LVIPLRVIIALVCIIVVFVFKHRKLLRLLIHRVVHRIVRRLLRPLVRRVVQSSASSSNGSSARSLCRSSDNDEVGRLPLHVAATNATTNRSFDIQSKISMLLAEYPEAARIADANGCDCGRLPIYSALESGIAWNEDIQDLFALEPKVIGNRDCVTSLYPFMLGAVGSGLRRPAPATTDAAETHEYQLDQVHSLSTIYTLLRADPAILNAVL
jgi:hypothetical protein